MKKTILSIIFILIFNFPFIFYSCTYSMVRHPMNIENFFVEYSSLKPKDFSQKISELKSKIGKDRSSDEYIYLRLAVLYIHRNNPSPDYHSALKALDAFSTETTKEIMEGVENLKNILKEIIKLQKENTELKDKIDKLGVLDIKIEEIREQSK